MTVSDLDRAYDYGCWANQKLFQVVAQLTPEQFAQDVAGGHGSVRSTLVHTMSAESGWLERCGGPKRGPALKPSDFATLLSVSDRWKTVETHMRAFLSKLTDADLDRVVQYANPAGDFRTAVLGQLLHHVTVHGVHHRGQVALMLRVLGFVPGNVDLLYYDAEKRGVPAW